MTQPQNPNADPLLARIDKNPTGADLIQVVNTAGGQAIVYRINQFQAIWYVGSGNPTFIPGELPTNLYLDNITGDIWQLGFDFIWRLLPSGGGGGSSTVVTLSTTASTITGTFNGINQNFFLTTAPDAPEDMMLYLNGVYQIQGTDYTIAGQIVTMTIPPDAGGQIVAVVNVASEGFVQTLTSVGGTITGTFNGINTVFNFVVTPSETANTVLFLNGIYQIQGTDYTMSGSTINMTVPPINGDQLVGIISTSGEGGGGVLSLNGLIGNLNLLAGSNITLTPSGSTITISSTAFGVSALNGLVGNVGIGAGTGITITDVGQTIQVQNNGVTSVNSLIGNVVLAAGANIVLTPSGNTITFSSTSGGVISVNGLTGAINITAGPGISVANVGGNLQVSNTGTAAQFPIVDIQSFGGVPKLIGVANEFTTATATATSTHVGLAQAKSFANNEGVVLYKAGNATALTSAPAAPTVTSQVVSGSGPAGSQQTVSYQAVGFDIKGGLSPASSVTTVSAPSVFGPSQVAISSINQTGGVVTVNFSGPLNGSVVAGMTLHIIGFTGTSKIFNGVWTIATAPTTSQVTFSLAGSFGAGTISSSTLGRVSNSAVIATISRASTGIITVTTVEPHNFMLQTGTPAVTNPTIVIIENCLPPDLNGEYPLLSASGSTFTVQTGIYSAETGSLNVNNDTGLITTSTTASTATVWEFNQVICTAPNYNSSTNPTGTVGYFIYSDSPSPGNGLKLIGKTFGGQIDFTDWGPFYGSGFSAPSYVPLTPPVSAQNQGFATTIVSGAGTMFLVLSAAVPTSGSFTIVHDDSQALTAAAAFRAHGNILLSPPEISSPNLINYFYVLNFPATIPFQINITTATGIVANETLTFAEANVVNTVFGSVTTSTPQFGQRPYSTIQGLANPMFLAGESFSADGLSFGPNTSTSNANNGQVGLQLNGLYSQLTNCSFTAGQNGTFIPLMYVDSGSSSLVSNCNLQGSSIISNTTGVVGQSAFGPPVPCVWYRANTPTGAGNAQVRWAGNNTMNGRGILLDQRFRTTGSAIDYYFGDALWNQAASQPTVMFWGQIFSNITVTGVINDTSVQAALANWTTQTFSSVNLFNCSNAGGPATAITTGNPIQGLVFKGCPNLLQTITGVGITAGNTNPVAGSTTYHSALSVQNQPLAVGAGGSVFGLLSPPVVTASPSGIGTITAGTYLVTATWAFWDGGESAPSVNSVSVTVNGAQGILVGWTTPSNVKGVYIYFGGNRQNASPFTGTSTTLTTGPGNISASPGLPSSGLPCVSPLSGGIVVAPDLILPSGTNKIDLIAPALTANRTVSFADGAQSTVVAVSLTTTTGGSPYTVVLQGMTSSSHVSITETNASAALDRAAGNVWVGTKSANQVIINTGSTAGETFDILATVN